MRELLLLWLGALLGGQAPDSSRVPREVELVGLQVTRPHVVVPYLTAKAGEPCPQECVQSDLDRMDRLGIFASIESAWRGDTLVYTVNELPWILPVPNGRISDEEGVSLGAGFKAPNLLGRAIAAELLFLAGSSLEFQASFQASRIGTLPLGWETMAGRTERMDEGRGYQEVSHQGFARLWGPTDGAWQLLGEMRLVEVESDRDGICLSRDRMDVIPSIRAGILRDTRDRRSLTSRGWYTEWSVEKAGRPLHGPVDAWQFLSDNRMWIPVAGRFSLLASNLLEHQVGKTGGWRTFVVGGVNSARGLPGAWAVAPSEDLATLEARWTLLPVRPVRVVGQNLYGGLQAAGGVDFATVWGASPLAGEYGLFAGLDGIVPFVERVRTNLTWSPASGAGFAFAFGLFEKTQAQRFRVR
ncbi:MAG: BamA/TamA family outer membrane protein [Fibrobacteres bacterium]|nr:BamA/TamA family outer membrane protein [Fibrobacterota bacterium]